MIARDLLSRAALALVSAAILFLASRALVEVDEEFFTRSVGWAAAFPALAAGAILGCVQAPLLRARVREPLAWIAASAIAMLALGIGVRISEAAIAAVASGWESAGAIVPSARALSVLKNLNIETAAVAPAAVCFAAPGTIFLAARTHSWRVAARYATCTAVAGTALALAVLIGVEQWDYLRVPRTFSLETIVALQTACLGIGLAAGVPSRSAPAAVVAELRQ